MTAKLVIPAPPLEIQLKLDTYPAAARKMLLALRAQIFTCAHNLTITDLVESQKWGEAAYSCKSGSTLRIDYKASNPDYCAVYFHCQSKLVATFKALYGDTFKYEGKRAILLPIAHAIPEQLNHCIRLALQYHQVKHLPLLGA
ncbi:DUF1801 domain-containing protein [Saccharophagus degradans]|uniref:YdhG-like domain-containing protein n=1 Tax=Saccharophagus degradans (strain 2-40 / ATCC 43961 / DSM 17024) TaxID=203122 RepID=Q21I57_SACD2|nr:DUF1801 domain-containing protein [Saccharophagus degradans]ABD81622.1 conserved hypothetical protein [Saccharophagus degradans 2-40]WGP00163.1 DUF1801 domain-containing protein [Saccharophagus degradans]